MYLIEFSWIITCSSKKVHKIQVDDYRPNCKIFLEIRHNKFLKPKKKCNTSYFFSFFFTYSPHSEYGHKIS